jgi:hypothetical protein
MTEAEGWYIVKQATGQCEVQPASQVGSLDVADRPTAPEQWGPFASQGEAISRRVGLIRAGKCKPV